MNFSNFSTDYFVDKCGNLQTGLTGSNFNLVTECSKYHYSQFTGFLEKFILIIVISCIFERRISISNSILLLICSFGYILANEGRMDLYTIILSFGSIFIVLIVVFYTIAKKFKKEK